MFDVKRVPYKKEKWKILPDRKKGLSFIWCECIVWCKKIPLGKVFSKLTQEKVFIDNKTKEERKEDVSFFLEYTKNLSAFRLSSSINADKREDVLHPPYTLELAPPSAPSNLVQHRPLLEPQLPELRIVKTILTTKGKGGEVERYQLKMSPLVGNFSLYILRRKPENFSYGKQWNLSFSLSL